MNMSIEMQGKQNLEKVAYEEGNLENDGFVGQETRSSVGKDEQRSNG